MQYIFLMNHDIRDEKNNQKRKSIFEKVDAKNTINMTVPERTPQIVISSSELTKTIPENATTTPLNTIPDDVVEWRWRFFLIGERKLVEISYCDDHERIYVDKTCKRITYDMDSYWDKFLVKTYYAYVPK